MTGRNRQEMPASGGYLDQPLFWEPSIAFLKRIVAFILAGSLAYLIALHLLAPAQSARALAVAMLLVVGAAGWILLSRHRYKTAVWVLATGIWTQITVAAYFLGGVASASTIVYPLIILSIGWLVGTRAAIATALLTSVATLLLALAQVRGQLPTMNVTHPLMRWLLQSGVFAMSVVLIAYLVRSYRNRLQEVERLGSDLLLRNAELRRNEAELSAARNRLSATLDALPDLLFEMDLEGRFHDFHSPRSDLLAMSPGEFIGRTVSEVMPAAVAELCMDALREAQATGRSLGKQYQLVLPQGPRWFELSAAPKPGDAGMPARFIVLARDITQRKLTEAALQTKEIQLQTILGATADGILAVDGAGRVILANRRFAELWCIPQALLDAKDDKALLEYVVDQLADPQAFLKAVEDLYRSDTQLTDSVSFKDGRVFEQFTSALVLNGERIGRVWSFRDITERRRTERRLNLAIDVSQVVLWEWDMVHDRLSFDTAMLPMLGLEPDDAPNSLQSWMEGIHPDDRVPFQERVALALQPDDPRFDFEYRMVDKRGAHMWIHTKGRVIQRDAEGRPTLAVGTSTNITARKSAEAANIQLEAQLRESQKMQALGTLAGGVAHDFNNALAIIEGNVELARQDMDCDHSARESLEEIAKASRRSRDLVQQILVFARRENNERKPTSLPMVALESARLLRAGTPAKVSLNVQCEADTPVVLADATQINQIILNLCSNALDAVLDRERAGVIDVRVDAHTQGADGGKLRPGRYARITVRDNGPGMDRETCARIFEPFYTTKPVGKGTGLGLSVVHSIVQTHEGSIEVESTPGMGSAFHVYFPAIDVQPVNDARPVQDAATAPGMGRHVLFVDDEEGLVRLMQRLLTRKGFRFSGYSDPRDALAAVSAHPGQFDLVVTDYNMPHLSGLELATRLKAIRPDLPIVLASGYITEELRAQAPAAGVRELIYKPNTVDELCEAVARHANAPAKSTA